jgi:hypothetical protein
MAFNYSPKIVTAGLVFALDAANTRSYTGTGTVWTDLSQVGNNGTLTNGPTFNTANGGSIVFDGVDDYVVMPSRVVDSTFTGLAVECWVKPTNATTSIIMENGTGYTTNGFYLAQETSTQFSFAIAGSTNQYDNVNASTNYSINNWYHIVGVWTPGSVVNIYINGVLSNGTRASQGAQTVLLNGNTNLYIGIRPTNSFPYRGNISVTRIYNRVLSPSEILQNFNAQKGRFGL